MALEEDDLAILSARFGVARFGASRFGFYPDDVEGSANDEPGEYVWKEDKPPTTQWTLQSLYSHCGERPVASFTHETCPAVDEVILFTDTSTPEDQVSFWYWTFGDGESSYDQNPTHSYSSAGAYTATLIVSGTGGVSEAATAVVSVGLDVTAAASNETPVAFEDVTFTPTVTPGRSPFTYRWEFLPIADGLVSWWELNEQSGTRYDAVGGNHLTDNNTVGYESGKIGNAAKFVKANSQRLTAVSGLGSTLDELTVALWYKHVSDGGNTDYFMFDIGGRAQIYNRFNGSTLDYAAWARCYDGLWRTCRSGLISEANVTGWNFFAFRYKVGELSSWYNTNQYTAVIPPTNPIQLSTLKDFTVGDRPVSAAANGSIDLVGVWYRALTDNELTELYNSGTGIYSPASSDDIATYTYIAEGSYTPEVTVTDANSCEATDTINITVQSPG